MAENLPAPEPRKANAANASLSPNMAGSLVRVEAMGVHESEANINNKFSRGGFSAVFFVQCLTAAGCQIVHLASD